LGGLAETRDMGLGTWDLAPPIAPLFRPRKSSHRADSESRIAERTLPEQRYPGGLPCGSLILIVTLDAVDYTQASVIAACPGTPPVTGPFQTGGA